MAMLCRPINLPSMPPEEFAAAMSAGDNADALRRNDLERAENGVRRGIGARKEDAQPAKNDPEERKGLPTIPLVIRKILARSISLWLARAHRQPISSLLICRNRLL
jgi:hypothetical protein